MDENGRALLSTVVSGNFIFKDNTLVSDYLMNNYGIIAVDLNFGNNKIIYERGLLLRNKFNSDFNLACDELNI